MKHAVELSGVDITEIVPAVRIIEDNPGALTAEALLTLSDAYGMLQLVHSLVETGTPGLQLSASGAAPRGERGDGTRVVLPGELPNLALLLQLLLERLPGDLADTLLNVIVMAIPQLRSVLGISRINPTQTVITPMPPTTVPAPAPAPPAAPLPVDAPGPVTPASAPVPTSEPQTHMTEPVAPSVEVQAEAVAETLVIPELPSLSAMTPDVVLPAPETSTAAVPDDILSGSIPADRLDIGGAGASGPGSDVSELQNSGTGDDATQPAAPASEGGSQSPGNAKPGEAPGPGDADAESG